MLQRHLHPIHPRVVRRSCCKHSSRPYVACIRSVGKAGRCSVDSSCRACYMSPLNITKNSFTPSEVTVENPFERDKKNCKNPVLDANLLRQKTNLWPEGFLVPGRPTMCGFQWCFWEVSEDAFKKFKQFFHVFRHLKQLEV